MKGVLNISKQDQGQRQYHTHYSPRTQNMAAVSKVLLFKFVKKESNERDNVNLNLDLSMYSPLSSHSWGIRVTCWLCVKQVASGATTYNIYHNVNRVTKRQHHSVVERWDIMPAYRSRKQIWVLWCDPVMVLTNAIPTCLLQHWNAQGKCKWITVKVMELQLTGFSKEAFR